MLTEEQQTYWEGCEGAPPIFEVDAGEGTFFWVADLKQEPHPTAWWAEQNEPFCIGGGILGTSIETTLDDARAWRDALDQVVKFCEKTLAEQSAKVVA